MGILARVGAMVAALVLLAGCASTVSDAPEGYTEVPADSGTLVASSGFDVRRDGFSFRNWGPPTDQHGRAITPAAMQSLFGDRVCSPDSVADACVLTPMGVVTAGIVESGMDGGHCFGMAAVAGLAYRGAIDTSTFLPAGATVYDAAPSPALDALVGRYFATQDWEPTARTERMQPFGETVALLRQAWERGDDYLMGFYTADGSAGHAVTPIAVRDLDDGRQGIVVYDNNFPGVEKMIVGNSADDSWVYTTAADPADDSYLFVGSPDNQLALFPLDTMTQVHDCPSCDEVEGNGTDYVVFVSDGGNDEDDPAVVNEPEWTLDVAGGDGGPDRSIVRSEAIANDNTAVLQAPITTPMTLTLSDLVSDEGPATVQIAVLADGWVARVESLTLDADAAVTLVLDPGARTVAMTSTGGTTADLTVATETGPESKSATVRTIELPDGRTTVLGSTPNALTLTDPDGTTVREVAFS